MRKHVIGYMALAVALSVLVLAAVVTRATMGREQAAAPAIAQETAAGGPTCGPTTSGPGVATQEFGKKGAKLDIVALLPITHGCHVQTEAALKKAYQQHPKDIHLTIVDLFGRDAPKYLPQTGGGQGAVVAINGKTEFTLKGQQVTLRRQEGDLYQPSQIAPIIEAQLLSHGTQVASRGGGRT